MIKHISTGQEGKVRETEGGVRDEKQEEEPREVCFGRCGYFWLNVHWVFFLIVHVD